MAIPWIKLETTTPDKPEVIRMAKILRIDQDAVVGKLVRVWAWADQHSVDGANVTITADFIGRLTGQKQFAAAMREVGWLTGEDGSLTFPHFGHHNGDTAKARAESARRMNKSRSTKQQQRLQESSGDVAESAQQKAQPDKIRLDKSTENNNDDNNNTHARAGENGGGAGSSAGAVSATAGTCTAAEAITWAEGYSKGNPLMLVISPEIVHAWHDNRQVTGWVTVKNQVELPINDWKADLRTYARAWRDRERSQSASTKHQAQSTKHSSPESPWSLQKRIEEATDQIRRIQGIDKFSNLPKSKQDQITALRTNISTWRTQLTSVSTPAA